MVRFGLFRCNGIKRLFFYNLCYPCFLTHGDYRLFIRLMFKEFNRNGFFGIFMYISCLWITIYISDEHLYKGFYFPNWITWFFLLLNIICEWINFNDRTVTKSNKLHNHYHVYLSNSIVRNLYTITKIPVQITKLNIFFISFFLNQNYLFIYLFPDRLFI